jgi:hypothetical protein
MKRHRMVMAGAAVCLFLAEPFVVLSKAKEPAEQETHWYSPSRYNPVKLFRRPKTAEEQLSADAELESKLSTQLRAKGQLPQSMELRDACSNFSDLPHCVAVLRASRSLKIDFSCLKWDVTGVKPKPVSDSCAGPAGGKAMRFDRAIDLLKPDADSKHEASDALQQARNEIKDASS